MILIIAMLAIALVVCGAVIFSLKAQKDEAEFRALDFDKKWCAEYSFREDAEDKAKALEMELNNYKSAFKVLVADEEEHGMFIRHRARRKPTAETYRIVFDLDLRGQSIIDDLAFRFKRNPFAPDDQGGERETARRLGRAEVVDFLINKVNVANSPNYDEALELAYMEQNNE